MNLNESDDEKVSDVEEYSGP
jgi:tetratricopeptide (TPR) repeat protein